MSGTDIEVLAQEIPLVIGTPQQFFLPLDPNQYQFVLLYRDADMGGWVLDINDGLGNPLVCGIPLVSGHDLLEQYVYLNIPGQLWITSDGDVTAVPTFDALGLSTRLYFLPNVTPT
jgi:hypothetical protein